MDKITWTNEQRTLSELIPWPRNPRQIKNAQAERLLDSVDTFGQVETLAIGPNGEVYNGHQRLQVLMQEHGPDFAVDVRVSSRSLTEDEREKLTVYLHKGAAGEWDFDVLANEFELDDLLDWGFEAFELGIGGDAGDTPSLDDLESQYGHNDERDFWPIIKVQVSPETMELYKSLMAQILGEDDAFKFETLMEAVDASVLGAWE